MNKRLCCVRGSEEWEVLGANKARRLEGVQSRATVAEEAIR